MELEQFFKDLKVVELASVLAGPLAGSFFGELGADVIKIENKLSDGDVTRKWKLPQEDNSGSSSAYYHSANYNKQINLLDFEHEDDYEKLVKIIRDADIIITNFLKSTADKLKIGIDQLKALNERAIIIQLSAYEYENNLPGFDLVMQAECGFISMNGSEAEVAKMPVAMIDILASHQIKEAALIGLLHKLKTGKGSCHFISLFKSGISALVNQGTNYLMENHIAKPIGTLHPNIAPYGEVITSKEHKKIMLAIGSDKQFQSLLNILNLEHLSEKYKSNKDRVLNRKSMIEDLNLKSTEIPALDLMAKLNIEKIPFAEVKNMKDVFQLKDAQEMVVKNPISNDKNGKYIKSIAFKSEFD